MCFSEHLRSSKLRSMKTLIAILFLISFNSFAVDICQFEETPEFHDALKAAKIKSVRTARAKFTSVEKQLIHKTVTRQDWLKGNSVEQSLEDFGGSADGEIKYYTIEGKQFILVHYWPGDNEYGAYFMLNKNGSHKLIAEISDSWISCK